MKSGKALAIPGLLPKLMVFSGRFTPRAVLRKIAKWMNLKA
jgi:hypothetical protein